MDKLPVFTSITELARLSDETLDLLEQEFRKDPTVDRVYHFPATVDHIKDGGCASDGGPQDRPVSLPADAPVVAGSRAVFEVCRKYKGFIKPAWIPGDTDLFFLRQTKPVDTGSTGGEKKEETKTGETEALGRPINRRFQFLDIDYVYSKATTVEGVLRGFDLACCRVAFNPVGDIWISAHAILALTRGKYFLPAYYQDGKQYFAWKDKMEIEATDKQEKLVLRNDYDKSRTRIAKYERRGYKPIFVECDKVPSWLLMDSYTPAPGRFVKEINATKVTKKLPTKVVSGKAEKAKDAESPKPVTGRYDRPSVTRVQGKQTASLPVQSVPIVAENPSELILNKLKMADSFKAGNPVVKEKPVTHVPDLGRKLKREDVEVAIEFWPKVKELSPQLTFIEWISVFKRR